MVSYTIRTRSSPEKVIEKARTFFGKGGLGLELDESNACCLYFTGGGGHVRVTVNTQRRRTVVDIEAREWDHHVKRFIKDIT